MEPTARDRNEMMKRLVGVNETLRFVANTLRRGGWKFIIGGEQAWHDSYGTKNRPKKRELTGEEWGEVANYLHSCAGELLRMASTAEKIADGTTWT